MLINMIFKPKDYSLWFYMPFLFAVLILPANLKDIEEVFFLYLKSNCVFFSWM